MKKQQRKESTITVDLLKQNGWQITGDPVIPAKKTLGHNKEIGDLELVVHRFNNCDMFALSLPDGALVNINPASIEELNAFERMILSYEPNY